MISGTRQVLLLNTVQILEHLGVKKDRATYNGITQAYDWVKNATVGDIQAFLKGNAERKAYMCTVGPRDCLYTPVGWIFYEIVSATSDFIGVRKFILTLNALARARALQHMLVARSCSNALLQKCVDCLTRAEAVEAARP